MQLLVFISLILIALNQRVRCSSYTLQTEYSGESFFDNVDFYSGQDPLGGCVQYQDRANATSLGLAYVNDKNKVIIKPNNSTATPGGRPSVRVHSKQVYNGGLFLFDINHMPQGCGTWAAFWMVGPSWPDNGEIDILEGVNTQVTNGMTIYTAKECTMQGTRRFMTGTASASNSCDVSRAGQGCGIKDERTTSYGAGLNGNGGGVYAMRWEQTTGIQIWFFPRSDLPDDLAESQDDSTATATAPTMVDWGAPVADYPFGSNCNATLFKDMKIVINLTFCGRWAGNQKSYSGAGCPLDCTSYVKNTPHAFDEAYWDINSLRVYQKEY
ncbi:hypothetical protein [Parasitella parasitica]|uniref:GH16 domain-containing protein n=1 Tax=Parasitella parasitica TaxID=35722 RepID=A0A0B7MQ93_9FUNG|nr:hypothetical protein [Parasitella parasitica]